MRRRDRHLRRISLDGLGSVPPAGRFIGGVFGFVFFGIGITVLIFMWAAPFGQFGSPPLFFRVFASFIALAFVAMGGTVCAEQSGAAARWGPATSLGAQSLMDEMADDREPPSASQAVYGCPHCGAPLSEGSDASPHGDVKCGHCNCWFNVHGK